MADWVDLIKQNNEASSPTTQANLDLLKQQTIGANLTNQGTAMSLDFRRQLAAGMTDQGQPQQPGGAPGADVNPNGAVTSTGQAPDTGDFSLNEAAARQHLFQKYSPIPDVWTPQEQAMRAQAALSGLPGAVDAVKAQHDARIQAQNGLRSKGAQQEYNGLYGVVTAPEGRAIDALSLVEPGAAARLQAAGMSDDQVRQHAARMAGLTHSVAQLPVEYRKDGVAVDKNTQQEVPGYDSAVGLSAENRADLVKAAQSITTVENTDGSKSNVPQWKADGAPSLESWVSHAGAIAASRGASPAQVTSAGAVPTPVGNRPAPSATPVGNPTSVGTPTLDVSKVADPTLRTALSDKEFNLPTPKVVQGTSATPAALDQQKATVAARTDLLKDLSETTATASQSLGYAKAAQAILSSKGAPATGLPGYVKNALSQWTGGVIDSSNYQEAAKYLGNLALQGAKGNYGSKMTGGEVMMQKDELAASTHMNPDAIGNILARNIRDAQYAIDTANRVRPYLATGKDPQQFTEWNQKYYPRDKIVNEETEKETPSKAPPAKAPAGAPAEGAKSTSKSGKPIVFKAGHWQYP